MRRYKETKIEVFLKAFRKNYLPNKKDTVKQCVLKSVFLILIVTIIGTSVYFVNYYSQNVHEKNLILQSRTVFEKSTLEKSTEHFLNQNSEYKAWLKLSDTELSNPVYQSKDNKFYLNHNQLKESSNYGALFFDYRTNLSDKNLVIYGNAAQDGKMFGVLKNLKNLDFFNKNSVLSLSLNNKTVDYKIFAVFVLNSKAEDDGGYVYNIFRKEFASLEDFDFWVAEARQRSVVTATTDVLPEDNILTLVTGCDDFEDARLIVMARSAREDEVLNHTDETATISKNPKYPKKWYENRNIAYPF